MAGASTNSSKRGSVTGPAGGCSSWPALSRPVSASSAASAPVRPGGGACQASRAARCWSSRWLWPVAQCRDSRPVIGSSRLEPGTWARSVRCVSQRPSSGTRAGAGYGPGSASSTVRRNRVERPSSARWCRAALFGTINWGASAQSSRKTWVFSPVSGSFSDPSICSTSSPNDSRYGSRSAARSARKSKRSVRFSGCGTMCRRGASRSVPSSTASGAPDSPAAVSGTSTIGRSERWR